MRRADGDERLPYRAGDAIRGDAVAVVRDDDLSALGAMCSDGDEQRRDEEQSSHWGSWQRLARNVNFTRYDVGMKLIRCLAAISLLALGCRSIPFVHRTSPATNEL